MSSLYSVGNPWQSRISIQLISFKCNFVHFSTAGEPENEPPNEPEDEGTKKSKYVLQSKATLETLEEITSLFLILIS